MSGVRYKRLDSIAEYVTVGYVGPSSEYFCTDGVPFLRTGNVGAREIIWTNLKQVVPSFHHKQRKSALKKGDVLVSRVISGEVNCAVVPKELDGANCGNVLIIRPGSQLHPEYLVQLIGYPDSQRALLSRQVGSAQAVINTSVLKAWTVPILPLAEQRRIAEVLDRSEALLAKRRAALAQLDSLIQSIFFHLFGDPIKNPHGFPVRPIMELIDPERPISYGILMPGPDQAQGVKYVRVVDMRNGGIELSGIRKTTEAISNSFRRSLLKTGDLLMSIRGHVGRFAVIPPELDGANITQDTARLAITSASPVFVRECLRTESFQRWMATNTKGVAVRGINLGDVKLMPIILPPRRTQEKFAHRVMAVEKLKTAQRASLAEMDALFASLQYHAFRGEL